MSTPGSKPTVHLAMTTPGEVDPTDGLQAGDVNDDQSITQPLPLPEGSPHQSGERAISRPLHADERAQPSSQETRPPARAAKTSLLEWLNLIEIGCRDATVTVQADDGRDGRLWCLRGEIVDAEWGPLKGAEAADRILSFREGDISVAFGTVDRPRAISAATGVLLLQTAQQTAGAAGPVVSESRYARHESPPPPASGSSRGLLSDMPVTRSNPASETPLERPVGHQRPYMAGALVGAAIAFTIWQWSGAASKRQPTAAAAPPPVVPAAPRVTIEPIADSRLRETPVNVGDGLPGVADDPVLAGGGERVAKISIDRQRHARTEVTRGRRAPAPALPRAQQPMVESAKARADLGDPSKPKIQIIEPQKPRVQIIEPGKPKVQIIEPLKSKTDTADPPQVKLID